MFMTYQMFFIYFGQSRDSFHLSFTSSLSPHENGSEDAVVGVRERVAKPDIESTASTRIRDGNFSVQRKLYHANPTPEGVLRRQIPGESLDEISG